MDVGEAIGYDSDRFLKDLVCLRFLPPEGYQSVARDAVALQETLSPLLSENASDVVRQWSPLVEADPVLASSSSPFPELHRVRAVHRTVHD